MWDDPEQDGSAIYWGISKKRGKKLQQQQQDNSQYAHAAYGLCLKSTTH